LCKTFLIIGLSMYDLASKASFVQLTPRVVCRQLIPKLHKYLDYRTTILIHHRNDHLGHRDKFVALLFTFFLSHPHVRRTIQKIKTPQQKDRKTQRRGDRETKKTKRQRGKETKKNTETQGHRDVQSQKGVMFTVLHICRPYRDTFSSSNMHKYVLHKYTSSMVNMMHMASSRMIYRPGEHTHRWMCTCANASVISCSSLSFTSTTSTMFVSITTFDAQTNPDPCTWVHMCVRVNVCTCIFVCARACTHARLCVYIWLGIYMCIWIYICKRIYVYIYIYIYIYMCMYI